SGRYSRLELDEDYLIALQDGNHLFPLGRFSGGEQDLANLCLRVAISQILAERSGGAPINFIILDEIFGSQDEERKVQILNALGKLSSQFRQIFIITHVDSIKDQLPVIMEVSQADEERSQVRMV
ncbi:MAG TPA: SbcC/MukB-like Walker B domain-containing protein, partial [bacterium]|nr:SbcC/MukB-like Walker B domain-containing protein [bacterium]